MFLWMKKYFYFCNKLLESSHQLPAEQPTRWDFSFIKQLICNTLNKPLP